MKRSARPCLTPADASPCAEEVIRWHRKGLSPISTALRRRASPRSPSTSMVSKARLTCCWSLLDGSGSTWRAFPFSRSPNNICCSSKRRANCASSLPPTIWSWRRGSRSSNLVCSFPLPQSRRNWTLPRLAEGLAQRLRALAAIRKAGEHLMSRPRMGRDFFARGEPEVDVATSGRVSYHANLYDLLAAYARQSQRHALARVRFKPREVWSLADARQALTRLVGAQADWTAFDTFLLEACADFRHAAERARVHVRSVARTRARRQDRTPPGESLCADLAPPDGDQSRRRTRRMTFVLSRGVDAAPLPPTAECAIRESSRAPASRRL